MNKKDGGFSLVELIVVVAIVAVLLAILMPSYIRYVEHSRIRHDDAVITNIQKAANALVVDDKSYESITGDVTVDIDNQGVAYQLNGVVVADAGEFLDEINTTVYGTTTPTGGFTSKTFTGTSGLTICLHYDPTLLAYVTEYINFPDLSIYHQ